MHPARELSALTARQAVLRRDIALGRARCAEAAPRVVRPLAWVDGVVEWWRHAAPWARVVVGPAGVLLLRAVFQRRKRGRSLLRGTTLVLAAVRLVRAGRRPRPSR